MTGYQRLVSDTAVLVIDMFNSYRHEDAEMLTPSAEEVVDPLAGLIAMAREREDMDLIDINDNYSDFSADQHRVDDGG